MNKSAISPDPGYFGRYVNLVGEEDLKVALLESSQELNAIDIGKWLAVGARTYASGKWTINDIVQHVIDTERIFCYRALRFARQDAKPLTGFSQDDYAAHTTAREVSVDKLLAEWKALRHSTLLMFDGFTDEMLLSTGVCNEVKMSVLAIGFTVIGHQRHHLSIIKDRYLPLAAAGGSGYSA